jgi:dolichol-phosphate mannosyltransferase
MASRSYPRTLIVTPTYNERDNLAAFVEKVRAAAPHAHLLIVDDASPDGTGALADELAAKDDHIRVMHRPGKLGLGTAYIQAFQKGMAEGFEWFVTMDADLSHDAKYLPSFFEAAASGADTVLGSRNIPGGAVEGWGLGRHVLSKGGSLYSRTILGVPIRDVTTGFRLYTKRTLEVLELEAIRSTGYSFQIEMCYLARRRGMKIVEVPIVFVDRTVGKSKMSRRIFIEAVGVVWKLRFDALRGAV